MPIQRPVSFTFDFLATVALRLLFDFYPCPSVIICG